ncbi:MULTISPECIES: hypothetical protein [Enterococcus]|uniref:hypothetical protein n=1 Tax=Enterococcus TaxID=1350 RepID=UPI00055835B6|nr:hypothetical protein [Enterococcus haemoperoxidus]
MQLDNLKAEQIVFNVSIIHKYRKFRMIDGLEGGEIEWKFTRQNIMVIKKIKKNQAFKVE